MVSRGRGQHRRNAFTTLLLVAATMSSVIATSTSNGHQIPKTQKNNGTLPYRDASLPVDARVKDLLQRMTIEEKAGQLFHDILPQGPNGTLIPGTEQAIGQKFISHFNLLGAITSVSDTVKWYNQLQQLAQNTRLGIPITLSSDPRHAFTNNVGTGFAASAFSEWPETLGLAAIRDADLVEQFANIARQEYLAVGIRSALHPQIDVATEPRWARISGTMGEDAHLTAKLAVAYINGFTGGKFGKQSVTTVSKHFPGSGPVQHGEDSHFTYGKNTTYPGKNLEHHLIPFKAAIGAGTRQIMPYYSRPTGTKYEEVAAGFNKGIVTDLLRGELGFDGIVVSDWGLITDGNIFGQDMPARAWGAENLTELQRAEKILNAGTDQFGGEQRTDLILELVKKGIITESRINLSVSRLLREKFLLGLFENPYVDAATAEKTVGQSAWRQLGLSAQKKAFTLLTNKDNILPVQSSSEKKFYVEGIDRSYLEKRGLKVVNTTSEADIAILRLEAPYEPRPGGFEATFRAGSLAYNATEKARQAAIYTAVPTVVDMYLNRPAVIPEIVTSAKALLGNFGASPDAFLDVLFGVDGSSPQGKLPFDLPRSMEAVENNQEDVPFDTKDPVYRYGYGLKYDKRY